MLLLQNNWRRLALNIGTGVCVAVTGGSAGILTACSPGKGPNVATQNRSSTTPPGVAQSLSQSAFDQVSTVHRLSSVVLSGQNQAFSTGNKNCISVSPIDGSGALQANYQCARASSFEIDGQSRKLETTGHENYRPLGAQGWEVRSDLAVRTSISDKLIRDYLLGRYLRIETPQPDAVTERGERTATAKFEFSTTQMAADQSFVDKIENSSSKISGTLKLKDLGGNKWQVLGLGQGSSISIQVKRPTRITNKPKLMSEFVVPPPVVKPPSFRMLSLDMKALADVPFQPDNKQKYCQRAAGRFSHVLSDDKKVLRFEVNSDAAGVTLGSRRNIKWMECE